MKAESTGVVSKAAERHDITWPVPGGEKGSGIKKGLMKEKGTEAKERVGGRGGQDRRREEKIDQRRDNRF